MSETVEPLVCAIKYDQLLPENMPDGDILIQFNITGIMSDDPRISLSVSYKRRLEGNTILQLDPDFELHVCKVANELIPGDKVPLVAMDISIFPIVLVFIHKTYENDADDISNFAQLVKDTIHYCEGKKEQSLVVINTNIDHCGLKKIAY